MRGNEKWESFRISMDISDISIYIYVFQSIMICMYIYLYIYVYICVYIYIYIYPPKWWYCLNGISDEYPSGPFGEHRRAMENDWFVNELLDLLFLHRYVSLSAGTQVVLPKSFPSLVSPSFLLGCVSKSICYTYRGSAVATCMKIIRKPSVVVETRC